MHDGSPCPGRPHAVAAREPQVRKMLRNIDEDGVRIDEDVPNNGRRRRLGAAAEGSTRSVRTLQRHRRSTQTLIDQSNADRRHIDGAHAARHGRSPIERELRCPSDRTQPAPSWRSVIAPTSVSSAATRTTTMLPPVVRDAEIEIRERVRNRRDHAIVAAGRIEIVHVARPDRLRLRYRRCRPASTSQPSRCAGLILLRDQRFRAGLRIDPEQARLADLGEIDGRIGDGRSRCARRRARARAATSRCPSRSRTRSARAPRRCRRRPRHSCRVSGRRRRNARLRRPSITTRRVRVAMSISISRPIDAPRAVIRSRAPSGRHTG